MLDDSEAECIEDKWLRVYSVKLEAVLLMASYNLVVGQSQMPREYSIHDERANVMPLHCTT